MCVPPPYNEIIPNPVPFAWEETCHKSCGCSYGPEHNRHCGSVLLAITLFCIKEKVIQRISALAFSRAQIITVIVFEVFSYCNCRIHWCFLISSYFSCKQLDRFKP